MILALAVESFAIIAHATPPSTYEFGSRATALAGAVTADGGDFSSVYYNPAGLVLARGVRVDVGYFYAHHALQTNGADNAVDPAHGIVGGLVAPGRLYGIPFAFGLATHLPDERLSRSRALPQMQPRWELYDNRVQLLYLAADVAIAPWPYLRIGGGIAFISSTRGTLDVYGDIAFPSANSSRLRHAVDADLRSVRYPQLGVQLDVSPAITLAFSYRGEFRLGLEIDGLVAGNVVVGAGEGATRVPGSYALSSRSTAVFLPQQATLGAKIQLKSKWDLFVDFTWNGWSSYTNPSARLNVALDLMPPPGLTLPIPALPPSVPPVPAGFHDTIALRIATEYRLMLGRHQLSTRVGYRFEPTPVPEQTGRDTNFLDSARHVPSLGLGIVFGERNGVLGIAHGISVDLHAAAQVLVPRTYLKSDPTDPIGDLAIGGVVLNGGATVGLKW
jgi:long-chain fatty acid transport protein